jgi:hypothetical protein
MRQSVRLGGLPIIDFCEKQAHCPRRPKRYLKAAGPSIQLAIRAPIRVSAVLAPKHVGRKEFPCNCLRY